MNPWVGEVTQEVVLSLNKMENFGISVQSHIVIQPITILAGKMVTYTLVDGILIGSRQTWPLWMIGFLLQNRVVQVNLVAMEAMTEMTMEVTMEMMTVVTMEMMMETTTEMMMMETMTMVTMTTTRKLKP